MTGSKKTTLLGILLVGFATVVHENQEMILSVVPLAYQVYAQLIVGALGLFLTSVGPSLTRNTSLRDRQDDIEIPPGNKFGPPV